MELASAQNQVGPCIEGIEDPFYPVANKAALIFQQLRDGVSDPLPDFETQKRDGPVIGVPEGRERLATWVAFEKKGENNDRAIVVLYRSPSNLIPAPSQDVLTVKPSTA